MTWGVESVVRPLTPAEAAFVTEQAAAWRRDLRQGAHGRGREILVGAAVAYGAAFAGYLADVGAVAFSGFLMGTFFLVLARVARRAAARLLAAARGPWDGPWQARETRVRARSVFATVSGDEGYAEFLLFEIPAEDWVLELTSLEPDGMFISARVEGAQLPRRGAGSGEAAYADAMDRGFVWRPRRGGSQPNAPR